MFRSDSKADQAKDAVTTGVASVTDSAHDAAERAAELKVKAAEAAEAAAATAAAAKVKAAEAAEYAQGAAETAKEKAHHAAENLAPKVESAREVFVEDVLPKVVSAIAAVAAGAAAAKDTATETAERAPDAFAVLKGDAAAKQGGGKGKRLLLLGAIAAGNWAEEIEITDEYVVAPRDAGGVRTFALRPMGDSMNKLVPEDGYICVDPDDVDLIDGKTYAIRSDMGEATFKRFHASPPRLEPCSTNPSHVTIPLGRVPFTVIGRVTYAFAPL